MTVHFKHAATEYTTVSKVYTAERLSHFFEILSQKT